MKSIQIKTLIFSLAVTFFSCTKEITVDVAHEPQTIILGAISNLEFPISIQVQQSVPLNSAQTSQPVNDATITLYAKDGNGQTEVVTDDFTVNQGTYTSQQEIAGIIGNSYWIEVTLSDGTLFRSQEELMRPVVPITSYEFTEDILDVKFSDPGNETNFYTASLLFLNDDNVVGSVITESNDVIFDGNENASLEIDVFDSPQQSQEQILALSNINFSSYQFFLNRSLQLEANEDNTPDEDGESSGGGDPSQLFSTPPVSVLGNITNTTNSKRTLGNFTVNSFSVTQVQTN